MTTCRPKSAMRCWRNNGAADIPRWLLPFLEDNQGKLTFLPNKDSSDEIDLSDGDWLIELAEDHVVCYEAALFMQDFDLTPEVGHGG